MPVPKHFKIVFRGDFLGTPEEWSFSTKFQRVVTTGPDAVVDDIHEDQVESALNAFLHTARFPAVVRCTEWRAYAIATTGRAEGPIKQVIFPTPIAGTAGGGYTHPTNVAMCITTEAEDRGPAKLGRFYLPTPMNPLAADARLSVVEATDLLDQTVIFLKAVSDAIDLPDVLSANMLNISALGTGAEQVVKRVRCGRVMDSIERRRRQLLEEPIVSGDVDW